MTDFFYLGLSPELFSALDTPPLPWYASRSDLLSLCDEGAETEMVCPRGLCPLGDREPGWALGNSSFIFELEEDMDTLGPTLWVPAVPILSDSPGVSLSAEPWTETLFPSTGLLDLGSSPAPAPEPVALAKASGSVCSSGEELDLFKVCEWEKGKSESGAPGVEKVKGGWSIGMPPSLTSSRVDLSSSWLEVEDDCRKMVRNRKDLIDLSIEFTGHFLTKWMFNRCRIRSYFWGILPKQKSNHLTTAARCLMNWSWQESTCTEFGSG